MVFPETERIVYESNPLEEVKCEIRFPPILAIDSSTPVDFQEAIRPAFPFFELKNSVKLPSGIPSNVAQAIERDLSLVGGKSFNFISENRNWTLSLSKSGLSLSCRQYNRWEPFRDKLQNALETLARIYQPSFFMHTCVRFKNSIRREPLGLVDTSWSKLLQPWVSGPFNRLETTDQVEVLQTKCVIRLPEDCGRVEAIFALGVHQPSKERAFIIESHVFHDTQKGINDVFPRLDALHRQAGFFFRWCITDELHRAMRPSSV